MADEASSTDAESPLQCPCKCAAQGHHIVAENESDELQFPFKLEPDPQIVFQTDNLTSETISVELKLQNISEVRQAFKVGQIYMVDQSEQVFEFSPEMGDLAPEQTETIKIRYTSKDPPTNHHHLVYVAHRECVGKTATDHWIPAGFRILLVDFLKDDGAPYVNKTEEPESSGETETEESELDTAAEKDTSEA